MRLRPFVCALVLALTVGGCVFKPPGEATEVDKQRIAEGQVEPGSEPVREGVGVGMEGITYTVFLTRQLNPADPEDRDYRIGPPAPPMSANFGVFLQACNDGKNQALAAEKFTVVDSQGIRYEPKKLTQDSIFAYRQQRLPPQTCIPGALTIARAAPAGGALVVFQLPLAAAENRPLELEIEPPSGKGPPAKVELDI
jgi:hypothetical protein